MSLPIPVAFAATSTAAFGCGSAVINRSANSDAVTVALAEALAGLLAFARNGSELFHVDGSGLASRSSRNS